jgi:DNA polymerase-3 subunit chi
MQPDPATSAGISFYHLTALSLERALPKLLEKAYAGGFRTLVVAASDEQAERINQLLWTYDPNGFLPHGGEKDGAQEQQPILIASHLTDANQATLVAVTDGSIVEEPGRFARILDIFDGNNQESVEKARTRWTGYKAAGCALTYLRQNENGGWEQKAVA